MDDDLTERLQSDLSNDFGAPVEIEVLNEAENDGVRILVCQLSYTQQSAENRSSRYISQTTVILQSAELDLPQFALRPKATGLTGVMFGLLGGFGNVNFPESPEFSRAYLLHGWAEQPVRVLFTPAVRDYFATHHGWSVRGHGCQLVAFRHNTTIPPEERTEFVRTATEILTLLRQGEQELDERPELSRRASGADIVAATQSMGLAGAIIQRQLQKHCVTTEELENFLQADCPRTIPPGLSRQILGDTLFLVFLGIFFAVGGLVGIFIFLAFAPDDARLIGSLGLGMMMVIGMAVTFFTVRHRRRKLRTLRYGEPGQGILKSVRSTGTTVNNQVQNVVSVEYERSGRAQIATCNVYGIAATTARNKLDEKEPVRVLVDPEDPGHAIIPDLITVFDGA